MFIHSACNAATSVLSSWNWLTSIWTAKNGTIAGRKISQMQHCRVRVSSMMIRDVRWRKEIPFHIITLPPFHLAASRTQQFANRSPRHHLIRIRPSLQLKCKLDSSVNRTSIHCLCNHRWRRWIHYSRFYCLINVKSLPWNVRQQCKTIDRSRRRTIDRHTSTDYIL